MRDLSQFQSAFARAVRGELAAVSGWLESEPAASPGLAVYRNTVARATADTLLATFPTVAKLVGEDWFRATAAVYIAANRPTSPTLHRYGDDFPHWLSTFEPAADTPYLAPIARLDRLWWESYFAADATALAAHDLSSLSAEQLASSTLVLHPSVRLASFEYNLGRLWLSQQPGAAAACFEIEREADHVVLWRLGMEVQVECVSDQDHRFLRACEGGRNLLDAADLVSDSGNEASLSTLLAACLTKGLFSHIGRAIEEDVT